MNPSFLTSNWKTIAIYEYKLTTSRIRDIRKYLPIISIVGLAIWIFWLLPSIVYSLVDDFTEFLLSYIATALIDFMLFMLFFLFFTFPIASILQDFKISNYELLLKTPTSSGDLLLGEFFGKSPFLAILAAFIGSFFVSLLIPLNLDVFQIVIIIMIFIIIFFLGTWFGTLAAITIRSRLMNLTRGQDLGKAIGILAVVPFIFIMYGMMAGYLDALMVPETADFITTVLQIFPSSWGSQLIITFSQNPGNIFNIAFIDLLPLFSLFGLLFFSLVGGLVFSNKIYSIEPTSFSEPKIKTNRIFYKFINTLGGFGHSGTILVTYFKTFVRNYKNLTWILYAIALITAMNIFFLQPDELDPEGLFVMSAIFGPLLAAFTVGDLTLQGKDNLLLYKKATTTSSYVKIKLYQKFLIIMPLVVIVQFVMYSRIPNVSLPEVFPYIFFATMFAFIAILFAFGLFLVNPAYVDKSGEYMINIQIIVLLFAMGFIFSLIFFDIVVGEIFGMGFDFFQSIGVFLIFESILTIFVLIFGIRNLDKLE